MGAGSSHGGRGEYRESALPGTIIVQRQPKFVALQHSLKSLRDYANWIMDNEPELERAVQGKHDPKLIGTWLRQASTQNEGSFPNILFREFPGQGASCGSILLASACSAKAA